MKKSDWLKQLMIGACVTYTVTSFLLLFIFLIVNTDLTRGLQARAMIFILPFSLFFSLADLIFRKSAIRLSFKVICHYLLTVGGALLFLFLPNKSPDQSGSGALVLFAVISVLYFIVMFTVLYFRSRAAKVKRDEAEYHSVYKK